MNTLFQNILTASFHGSIVILAVLVLRLVLRKKASRRALCMLWALVALLPIWCYNGRRGYSNRTVQCGFYAFYPVHILILSLIALYA